MSKTLVDIPDELMARARQVAGSNATKAETVRLALRELVQRRALESMMAGLDAGDLSDLDDAGVIRSAQR